MRLPPPSARLQLTLALLVVSLGTSRSAGAAEASDLTNLSLEELAAVEVSIVSRRRERATGAAAAVTVITGDDIRRSGATTIAEAFRLSPGLHVGQVTSSTWAVSSRGFGSLNSSKLLVLTDGRSLYTPLFSGVFWDVQDTLLEDIDRIEIIRGPGASVWGAGAMNGVINVLTRSAKDTHGTFVEAGGGTHERGFVGFRQGGQAGSAFHYRLYGKLFDRHEGYGAPPGLDDKWRMGRLGVRTDTELGANDVITVQGDAYVGEAGNVRPSLILTSRPVPMGHMQTELAGGNVFARWNHRFGDTADFTVRTYYDRTHRDDDTFQDDLDTFDVDLHNRIQLPASQELIWGFSYRYMRDHFQERGVIDFRPPRSVDHLFSGFVQDTASLLDDSLRITLGSKLEHNDFSGFEVEPSLRVAADITDHQTLWAAASRASRVPTRFERDINGEITTPAPMPLYRLAGNPDLDSEKLTAVELGHRWQASPRLHIDESVFYHRYHSLLSFELGTPFMEGDRTVQPISFQNEMHGHAFGGELAATWAPLQGWTLAGSYSYVKVDLIPDGMDINRDQGQERAAPRHQLAFRSFVDLPGGFSVGAQVRLVDRLQTGAMPDQQVDAYATGDVRLGWQARSWLELSVVGQSLFQDHHREFPAGTEVNRSVYGKVAARF